MFTTRIPGLFLENCILAHTCGMGHSVPKSGSGDHRVPLAETSAAAPAEPAGPGWGGHQAFPQPRCCLCMSRGPLCRAVPLAQDTQLKAATDGKGWPRLHALHSTLESSPGPRRHSCLHRHGTSPQPKSQTSRVGLFPQSTNKLHSLASSIIKTLNNTGSTFHP